MALRARGGSPVPVRRAAQYLRMSRESQRYSPAQQAEAIATFAAENGFEIVRTYVDRGRSGVTAKNRMALQQLLADVVGGQADFQTLLVYDVSRWGRYQNPDQAGHYEFLCVEAGVRVEYCAENFVNDDSLGAVLQKAIQRAGAAEYSRNLSRQTARGQAFLARRGYWQGGPPGYGFRRQMVGPDGAPGLVLENGEHKGIAGHHVRLVPGPRHEVIVVNRIYRLFAREGLSRRAIVARLNGEGIATSDGRPWSWERVTEILSSRRYVGDIVFHKTEGNLGVARRRTAPEDWGMARHAVKPLVPRALFDAAQARLRPSDIDFSTDAMLAAARRILEREGRLTYELLKAEPGIARPRTFTRRFGGMRGLGRALGQSPSRDHRDARASLADDEMLRRLADLLDRHGYLTRELIHADRDIPSPETYRVRFGSLEAAYARIGYPPPESAWADSPVGRARQAAAAWVRRRARISDGPT